MKEDTMAKLTDTQRLMLSAAANRNGGSVLPLPGTLKLGRETADEILNDLLKKKLVAERPVAGPATVWRKSDAGQPMARDDRSEFGAACFATPVFAAA
jgi:hypothetical protein